MTRTFATADAVSGVVEDEIQHPLEQVEPTNPVAGRRGLFPLSNGGRERPAPLGHQELQLGSTVGVRGEYSVVADHVLPRPCSLHRQRP